MQNTKLTRRQLLQYATGSALGLAGLSCSTSRTVKEQNAMPAKKPPPEHLPPVRAITQGPKFHWFGYYDKLQFDPTCRYVLAMEVDFEHRSPKADDVVKIAMVDLQDNDRWTELDKTTAWGWQQGCMLQWRPGSASEIIFNDRRDNHFVCHILDVKTGKKQTLPQPIYTVSPDGCTALTADFRRINDMRPGYGYAGLPDPHSDELAPKDSGIFRLDLETGKQQLIISLADIARFDSLPGDPKQPKHYFNHLLFNTDGSRFIFLHRWREKKQDGFGTRMLTAKPDGTDICIVDDYGRTSHFIWRDPNYILAWTWHPSNKNAFHLFEDCTRNVKTIGKNVMTENGHCTYLPGNKWILNDTYPDKQRKQHVYLYNIATGSKITLGRFYLPPQYRGEWRCDTHPRFSPDGRSVIIDSPHKGNGRQMYLIDITKITKSDNA
jgi:hypothetical protein